MSERDALVQKLLDKLNGHPAGYPERYNCSKCREPWFSTAQEGGWRWSYPICPACTPPLGYPHEGPKRGEGWWTR